MKPLYDGLNAISAKAVVRQISLAEANAVMPTLKAKLAEMISWFHKAKRLMAMLHCPADVLFTDSQGRRVGVLNGQQVNEIPGAEIRSQGEVEIYVLPSDLQYAVTITGTGQGQAGLDIIRAESATKAGLTSFDAVPTAPGSTATASLLVGGKIDAIMAGGQAIAPKIVGTMEGDSVTWKTGTTNVISPPPKPVDTPQPGQPGTLIVCRKVVNGQPQNAADSFTSASEVWCLATYTNIPQNTTAECVWKRNGQEITRSQRAIGGNGWVAFSINTSAAGGLQAGTYTVAITAGTASLGTRQFTIGASQPGAATQPSSQPPSGVTIPVRGGNLLTAAQLPSGLKVPAGTTARASQAPFAVGRPFFGGNGEVFLFSGDPKAGQILYSPAVGVGHTCCESSILQGGNWRGGAYRDGKFIISVDYAPAAGNSTSGVFELKLDGSNRRLALQRDYGGLGDLIEAPQGGFYFTEFESGENIFHLAAEGQAETPLVKQNWPGGIVRLGYDRQSKALYGLNWGREWWGGSVNGVFRLAASGDMQLVSQAAAGTTFDDMAISPGGPFAAGPYVMDATNGRILRIVSGGSPVAVITGLRKPQSMGFHPTTGQMMVVCDGNTLLWVTGPTTYGGGQPGGTQTPAQITTPAGGGPAISLAGGSSSQPGPTSYPKSDGFIRLDVKYTKPGVVFDTVGINAATRGDFTLSIGSDGNLLWQIWNPDIQSKVRLSNGWHLLTGNQPLQAGKWYSVLVTYGTRGFKLKLGRTVMAHDDVVLSLSGNPIYLGDYPGDNHWGANYSIYRSFAGEVRGLEFGQ